VRLDWHKRGQLTLSHHDANGHSATMQVPVKIHGKHQRGMSSEAAYSGGSPMRK
jgi:hypothetical protein